MQFHIKITVELRKSELGGCYKGVAKLLVYKNMHKIA